jgi:hypothetical protein
VVGGSGEPRGAGEGVHEDVGLGMLLLMGYRRRMTNATVEKNVSHKFANLKLLTKVKVFILRTKRF